MLSFLIYSGTLEIAGKQPALHLQLSEIWLCHQPAFLSPGAEQALPCTLKLLLTDGDSLLVLGLTSCNNRCQDHQELLTPLGFYKSHQSGERAKGALLTWHLIHTKNSEQIINWHFLARGVGQYVPLVPNMKIQLTYIWKRDLKPPYTVHFYSRNKNNDKLTARRLIV